MTIQANHNKSLEVIVNGVVFERLPIKTHIIMKDDNLLNLVDDYVRENLQNGDVLFITEKIVAITQGRAYPLEEIEPRKLATFLARYVTKTPYGIGLGMPETMEMALRECGTPKILFASGVAAVTKLFGRRGDFYRVAGSKARAIDGPTTNTIPPYNRYVVLGPKDPNNVACNIKDYLGMDVEVIVTDINDLGGNILGMSDQSMDPNLYVQILQDNPLGQECQSTPVGIIRKAK